MCNHLRHTSYCMIISVVSELQIILIETLLIKSMTAEINVKKLCVLFKILIIRKVYLIVIY